LLVQNEMKRRIAGSRWESRRVRELIEDAKGALRVFRSRPLSAFMVSVWFGLCAGVLELVLTLAQKPFFDRSPGFFRMNRHIVWCIPAVNLALFACCGVLLALGLRLRPSLGVRAVLAAPVGLGVLTLFLSQQWLHVAACWILASIVAFRLTGRIARNIVVFGRIVRYSAPMLGLAAASLIGPPLGLMMLADRRQAPTTDSAPVPPAQPGGPNVVLIVLDTVRADHLSLGGYARNTSPNLAGFARSSIVFEQARSTAPWTLPSHASIMTGRWPHELSATIDTPLDATYPTLAEYLAKSGYATAGFVANNAYTGAETGLCRGFERYDDHVVSLEDIVWNSAFGRRIILQGLHPPEPQTGGSSIAYHRKNAAAVVDDALRWIGGINPRPFFAFLNLYDAHDPYLPPSEFDRHFGIKPETAADLATLDRWFLLDKKSLIDRQKQLVCDAYDDCIAYIDRELGRFLDSLDRSGHLANTLVIVTADHGEHLGEHGLYGHATSLYDQEIHVPLVVHLPGAANAGRSISASVSLRDLAATIAEFANAGRAPFPGRSLARFWETGDAPGREVELSFSEVDGPVNATPNQGRSPAFRGPLRAMAAGSAVYIRDDQGNEELFDVNRDPMQTHNLAGLPRSRLVLERFRSWFARLDSGGPEQQRLLAAQRAERPQEL
jgi:arylsulfatase A-like enzyme